MSDHAFLFPRHDDWRFAPSILLRSALFGALPPGKARKVCGPKTPSEITTVKSISIKMLDGPMFDQGDLDVLLAIVDEAAIRDEDSGKPVTELSLPMRGLLFALNRPDGGKNRTWLLDSLMRLGQSQLTCKSTGKVSASTELGRLISVRADTCSAQITINNNLRDLYKAGYTGINWVERQQLSPLGKWMHAFYSSHGREPLPLKVQTIRRLSGRAQDAMGMASKFGDTLAAELEQLAAVTNWQWAIEEGKVVVVKPDDGIGGNGKTVADYRARLEGGEWDGEEI